MTQLLALLKQARRLNNQTARDSNELDAWHQAVDAVIAAEGEDEPGERFDEPARVKHREFIEFSFRQQIRRQIRKARQ